MRDRINIHHDELIKRREDYYRKKRNHDDKIVFMKINFTEHRKRKNSKNEQRKTFKCKIIMRQLFASAFSIRT